VGRGGRWGCCWAWMRFPNRPPPPPPQRACRHHARLAPQKRRTKRAVGNFFSHAGWRGVVMVFIGTPPSPTAATQSWTFGMVYGRCCCYQHRLKLPSDHTKISK
jgi:hypothetical protein